MTGPNEGFVFRMASVAKFNFEYCGPFASYVADPYSVFTTKAL